VVDIEAIKADREAGTPGPWYIDTRESRTDGNTGFVHYDPPRVVLHTKLQPAICKCHLQGGDDPDQAIANAHRIARVPELEDAVIALTARVAALEVVLAFYANSKWEEDYPGGIKYGDGTFLDYGDHARAALAKPGNAP